MTDASGITFAARTKTDWSNDVNPGDVDDALNQLALRLNPLASGGWTDDRLLRANGTDGIQDSAWEMDSGSGLVLTAQGNGQITATGLLTIQPTGQLNLSSSTGIVAFGPSSITLNNSQTVDGRDVSVDGTKLDTIETSATADQSDAEIRAAVEAATDSNVFTDADHTKLDGIEASADVTDAANVAAAGALMGALSSNSDGTDDVTNTATETDYTETQTLAADALNDLGTVCKIRIGVKVTSKFGGTNMNFRIYVDGTEFATTGGKTVNTTNGHVSFGCDLQTMATGASGSLMVTPVTGNVHTNLISDWEGANTKDLTGTMEVKVSADFVGISSSDHAVLESFTIEVVKGTQF